MEPSEYERIHRLESTHFWYRGLHALVSAAVARHLPRDRRGRVLDAGCGTGGLTRALAVRADAVGVDLSPLALALARTRGPLALVRATVGALPFAGGTSDAVVVADVLYHRAVPDDVAALVELGRVCRGGGVVVLNLPAHAWLRGPHDAQVHTARRYSRAAVRELARRAGLQVAHLAWFNCALLPVAALRRGLAPAGAAARSDLAALPAVVNAPLAAWMRLEAAAAGAGLLPWGLSLFAVLRRPALSD